jgi:hypothetical protein
VLLDNPFERGSGTRHYELGPGVNIMRSGYDERPKHHEPEARGKVAAILIVLVITALFVAFLRHAAGL